MMKKRIFGALALVSFLLMIGSVGAMDCECVSVLHGCFQTSIFLASSAVCTKLAGGFEP